MLFFFFSQNRKVKGSPSEARSYLALEEDCRSREYYFNNKIKSLLHSVLPLFHPGHQALEKGHSPRNVTTQTPLNMHGEDFQPAVQGVTCPGSVNNSNCAYNFLCVALKIHPTDFSSMSSNSAAIYYILRVETRALDQQQRSGCFSSSPSHFSQSQLTEGKL